MINEGNIISNQILLDIIWGNDVNPNIIDLTLQKIKNKINRPYDTTVVYLIVDNKRKDLGLGCVIV